LVEQLLKLVQYEFDGQWAEFYLIDFQNMKISDLKMEKSIGGRWIKDNHIYYTYSTEFSTNRSEEDEVECYLKRFDIMTNKSEIITQGISIYRSIYILDDYFLIPHLGFELNSEELLVNFFIFSFVIMALVIKRFRSNSRKLR